MNVPNDSPVAVACDQFTYYVIILREIEGSGHDDLAYTGGDGRGSNIG